MSLFASTALLPEGASEVSAGILPFAVTEHLSGTNIDEFFLLHLKLLLKLVDSCECLQYLMLLL